MQGNGKSTLATTPSQFFSERMSYAPLEVLWREHRHESAALPFHVQAELHKVRIGKRPDQRFVRDRASVEIQRAILRHDLNLAWQPGIGLADGLEFRVTIQVANPGALKCSSTSCFFSRAARR